MCKYPYLWLNREALEIEWRQCKDEGREIAPYAEEFKRLVTLDFERPENQIKVQEFLDMTINLPILKGFAYQEPSNLEKIRTLRGEAVSLSPLKITDVELEDKINGAWLGRTCGCLLGKPVEGWRRKRMHDFLRDAVRSPLSNYFSTIVPDDIRKKYEVTKDRPFIEFVECMPEDDDMNYTIAALGIIQKYGRDFTPEDVADFWMNNLPILRTCTAERVAYRNFCQNIFPPASATFRNPYREWIGAQIRADLYGYIMPGQPECAASLAWRDSCISHVKNGIYGAMWVAAMLASCFATDDIRTIIRAGLAQIPSTSRLHKAICEVMEWHAQGVSYDEAVMQIHNQWDENNPYDWCHTISNAMIVATGLLWGGANFEKSICRAVQACFDTDCNGATVGSIVGLIVGARNIPEKWSSPIHDTIETGLSGKNRLSISRLVKDTLEVIEKIQK